MIKIRLIAVGKVKEKYFAEAINEYTKRLSAYCEFTLVEVKEENYKNPSQAEISSDGDVPFINAGHLVDGKLDFSDMNYISEEKYNQLNSGKIQENERKDPRPPGQRQSRPSLQNADHAPLPG